MKKTYDYDKLVDTVKKNSYFFKRSYYHSIIDSNPVKLESILNNGILCKDNITLKGLPSIYTHQGYDNDSKNGFSYISLSEYTDDCDFNMLFSSFTMHTLTSLSLMIKKSIKTLKKGERETYFNDELFTFGAINRSDIKGIIIPENLSKTKIKRISFLTNDLYNYTWRYLENWLKYMQKYLNINIPRSYIAKLFESCNQFSQICREYECPERWLDGVLRTQRERYGQDLRDVLADIMNYLCECRYGLDNPEYIKIVKMINNDTLPIYEISQRSLRKLN